MKSSSGFGVIFAFFCKNHDKPPFANLGVKEEIELQKK